MRVLGWVGATPVERNATMDLDHYLNCDSILILVHLNCVSGYGVAHQLRGVSIVILSNWTAWVGQPLRARVTFSGGMTYSFYHTVVPLCKQMSACTGHAHAEPTTADGDVRTPQ